MNNHIYVMPGGDLFSRVLQCGIIPLADREFDNVYLTLSPFDEAISNDEYLQDAVNHIARNRIAMQTYGIDRPYDHIVGYVLDQHTDHTYEYKGFLPVGKMYNRDNPIEKSPRLADYKRVVAKLKIQNKIRSRVDDLVKLVNITSRILGVHVRLTTMGGHADYHPTTDDYIRTIRQELDTGKYDGIFVTTDNVESLVKLEREFSDIIRYYPNLLRLPTENIANVGEWSWEYDMFFHKRFWQESFMECMTLGRCGGLICRDSNLSNMAVVFSNSIDKVTRVSEE